MPAPTRLRLARLFQLLETEEWTRQRNLSSRLLARWLEVTPDTLRRDLSWLEGDHPGRVWEASELRERLGQVLGLPGEIRTALVGLDDWALELVLRGSLPRGLKLVAGFDSRQNRLETLDLDLPLYPSVELPQQVARLGIEAAILAVSPQQAPRIAERLAQSRIRGILNLSGYPLKSSQHLRVVDGSLSTLWSHLALGLVGQKESFHGSSV